MATDPKDNEIKDEKLEEVSGGKTRTQLPDGGEPDDNVGNPGSGTLPA